jgi:CDP-diacylglycerol---glycerol-3-phosphate 3-phosphatidyltransferase
MRGDARVQIKPPHAPLPLGGGVEGTDKGWRSRVPNALTIARLVMSVIVVALLAGYQYPDLDLPEPMSSASPAREPRGVDILLLVVLALFVVAAITDALDGYLARRWKVISVFGRVMDPFADKLLVLGTLIMLAGEGFTMNVPVLSQGSAWQRSDIVSVAGFTPWMVVVILGRELLITSLRGAMESRGVDFSATTSGKLKMILQSAAIPLVMLLLAIVEPFSLRDGALARTWAGWVIEATAWLTTLVTAWSGVPYVLRAMRATRTPNSVETKPH